MTYGRTAGNSPIYPRFSGNGSRSQNTRESFGFSRELPQSVRQGTIRNTKLVFNEVAMMKFQKVLEEVTWHIDAAEEDARFNDINPVTGMYAGHHDREVDGSSASIMICANDLSRRPGGWSAR